MSGREEESQIIENNVTLVCSCISEALGTGHRAQVGLSSSLQLMERRDNEARQDGHDLAREFRLQRNVLGGCLKGPVLHKKLEMSQHNQPMAHSAFACHQKVFANPLACRLYKEETDFYLTP